MRSLILLQTTSTVRIAAMPNGNNIDRMHGVINCVYDAPVAGSNPPFINASS